MNSLLAGIFVISAIAALLAFLLEVADSYIADYGIRSIDINGERKLEVAGGRPLLGTLMEEGVFVPSACGGKGTCAYCKVGVLEGGGAVLPTETPYLSAEELAAGIRLACQVKVKKDLRLELPPEYFSIREYRVLVEKAELCRYDIRKVTLKILEPAEGITFVPGQYLQLQVPGYEGSARPEFRAYSIASDTAEHGRVALMITKVEGGIVSTYVHDHLREGDELVARGPFGDFHLLDSERDILLIATGSGLAPILSILFQIEREGIGRKTTLFFGGRGARDIFCRDELAGFEERLENFTFLPALSQDGPEEGWTGERGRVTSLIEKYVADGAPVDVHLCGSPPMVRACIDLLAGKGIAADKVAYDKFE
jgi:Na+-transporting NADH:ubiquinone oxidoreductase subunit F